MNRKILRSAILISAGCLSVAFLQGCTTSTSGGEETAGAVTSCSPAAMLPVPVGTEALVGYVEGRSGDPVIELKQTVSGPVDVWASHEASGFDVAREDYSICGTSLRLKDKVHLILADEAPYRACADDLSQKSCEELALFCVPGTIEERPPPAKFGQCELLADRLLVVQIWGNGSPGSTKPEPISSYPGGYACDPLKNVGCPEREACSLSYDESSGIEKVECKSAKDDVPFCGPYSDFESSHGVIDGVYQAWQCLYPDGLGGVGVRMEGCRPPSSALEGIRCPYPSQRCVANPNGIYGYCERTWTAPEGSF
jgi:hypothetical protein